MEFFTQDIQILAKALDLRMVNHRVISSNIANVDTPGYQANKMDFEGSIQQAIDSIESGTTASVLVDDPNYIAQQTLGMDPADDAIILPTGEQPIGLDGNNVNMEVEVGGLTENSMMYQLTAQMLSSRLRQLSEILSTGGG